MGDPQPDRRTGAEPVDCPEAAEIPVSPYPFKITDISDEWGAVLHGGAMVECKVSLTIEEYL